MMIIFKRNVSKDSLVLLPVFWSLLLLVIEKPMFNDASEYPGRECCDSAPPPPPQYYTTTTSSPVPSVRRKQKYFPREKISTVLPPYMEFTASPSEGDLGGSIAMRNCLLSRKLCAGDPACRKILEIIPRVCGPETVACSTVTVNKCLAALRTVRGFPYFSPVCLCREPHLDRDCNAFREYIFDHPCEFVFKDGDESPYAVHALPTCEYALRACDQLPACRNTYDKFQAACKVEDGRCRMEDSETCLWAWTQLKQLPMFGCICPNQRQRHQCDKTFSAVHQNPCVGLTTSSISRVHSFSSLSSTCETALKACSRDPSCRRLLDPILSACHNNCNREACMETIRNFYRNVDLKWANEVALCLCKKTEQKNDQCLIAQEKLHPSCSRRHAGNAPMLCSEIARSCKDDSSCRHRLEFYEQACAVDSDTKRCAGSTGECRRALLGIMGTRLRNICTCVAAPSPRETYTCLDWQRILWFNPCVVESQTDYHSELLGTLRPGEKMTTSPSITVRWTTDHSRVITRPVDITFHGPVANYRPTRPPRPQSKTTPRPPRRLTTRRPDIRTTLPPEHCKKELRNGKSDAIVVGRSKRYYKSGDPCSELCKCSVGRKLVCDVLGCIASVPCSTDYAVYTHAAPAYHAQRGECVCYSESFICARPKFEDNYDMDHGTFLMIGFSKKEEELLHRFTHLTVTGTIHRLKDLYNTLQADNNETSCLLEMNSQIGENLILQAKLEEFDEIRENMTGDMFYMEKQSCERGLEEVSRMINKKDPLTYQDDALSMFLVSEVQTRIPAHNSSGIRISVKKATILLSFSCLLIDLSLLL